MVYFGTGRKSDLYLDRDRDFAGATHPSKNTQFIIGLKNPENRVTLIDLYENRLDTKTGKITVTVGGTTDNPVTSEIETLSIEGAGSDKDKLDKGWYLALNQSTTLDNTIHTGGERVVFSPKQSFKDVIFSTWGLDEYDNTAGVVDPCIEDRAYGKVLILDKKTGLLGTGEIQQKPIGGFMVKENIPGAPSSGFGITESALSGEAYGRTTLSKDTLTKLRQEKDSTHALPSTEGECKGSVADDLPNLYQFTVKCPTKSKATSRRISIRTIL